MTASNDNYGDKLFAALNAIQPIDQNKEYNAGDIAKSVFPTATTRTDKDGIIHIDLGGL